MNLLNTILTLLRELIPSLERFILSFIVWYESTLTERAKTVLNASREASRVNRVKEKVKRDVKKLSGAELSRRSVIDD